MTKLVKFNVGGQRFEVSQSILESLPQTMVAKSASERWQEDSELVIFIEHDGEIYRHVLSYLRDGKLNLPLTVTKKGLLSELEYYGVEGVDDTKEDDSLIKSQAKLGIDHMRKEVAAWRESANTLNFVAACVNVWQRENIEIGLWDVSVPIGQLSTKYMPYLGSARCCNVYLDKFGLQIEKVSGYQTNVRVTLKSSSAPFI